MSEPLPKTGYLRQLTTDEINRIEMEKVIQDTLLICAHYQCPVCLIDMNIAGRYDKSERSVEGVSKVMMHQCHGCGKAVTPKLKGIM